jgi:hypothetical protein
MARTKRGVAYKHYWGMTKKQMRDWIDNYPDYSWISDSYIETLERDYNLHGTDARNFSPRTRYYFNRVHRIGRRIERDQLRPHFVQDDEYYDFNDSRYRARYKGVWWDIY